MEAKAGAKFWNFDSAANISEKLFKEFAFVKPLGARHYELDTLKSLVKSLLVWFNDCIGCAGDERCRDRPGFGMLMNAMRD